MNVMIVFLFSVAAFGAGSTDGSAATEMAVNFMKLPPSFKTTVENMATDPQAHYEQGVSDFLWHSMDTWMGEPTGEHAADCEWLIDRLLQSPSPLSANSYYQAAKSAEILGLNDKAMDILKASIAACSESKTPGLESVPVKISANVWLGRLARDAGLADEAIAAYSEAADAVVNMPQMHNKAWCLLCIGEIEWRVKGEREKTIEILEKAQSSVEGVTSDGIPNMESEWAIRFQEEIEEGTSKKVCPNPTYLPIDWCVLWYGAMTGISIRPFNLYEGPRGNALLEYAVQKARTETKNAVDGEVAQFLLAELYRQAKRWEDASAVFGEAFASAGFLAPYAGLTLADCLVAQGKEADAAKVLADLAQRWPAYGGLVIGKRRQYYEETRNGMWKDAESPEALITSKVPPQTASARLPGGLTQRTNGVGVVPGDVTGVMTTPGTMGTRSVIHERSLAVVVGACVGGGVAGVLLLVFRWKRGQSSIQKP